VTRLLLLLIAVYRRLVSPLLPATCRYYPTCSAYAEEAVRRFGWLRGGGLAVRRLLRCHPGRPGGFDPVVEERGGSASAAGPRHALVFPREQQ